jgi:hypothetical protein
LTNLNVIKIGMSEEIKTSPDVVPDSNTAEPFSAETLVGEEAPTAAPAARKGDPWKTAFIVLAGITIISGGIYFTTYGRKTDLPTVPAADPNAMPVQMANPATGASEQGALRQPLPSVVGNAADMQAVPGDGYDPWANPGRYQTNSSSNPYPVTPVSPPGQQMYMDTNPNSPFMQDGNTYIMVPANTNTQVNANRGGQANTNRPPRPVASPSPGTAPPGNTAVPQTQPKPDVKTDTQPANKPAKPVKKPTGKPAGTSTGRKAGNDAE